MEALEGGVSKKTYPYFREEITRRSRFVKLNDVQERAESELGLISTIFGVLFWTDFFGKKVSTVLLFGWLKKLLHKN